MSNFHQFLTSACFVWLRTCVFCTCPSVSQRYARRSSTVALAWDCRACASTSAHRACVRCLCLTATFSCLTLGCFCLTAMCSEPQDRVTCSDYSVKWFHFSTQSLCPVCACVSRPRFPVSHSGVSVSQRCARSRRTVARVRTTVSSGSTTVRSHAARASGMADVAETETGSTPRSSANWDVSTSQDLVSRGPAKVL